MRKPEVALMRYSLAIFGTLAALPLRNGLAPWCEETAIGRAPEQAAKTLR
jgi:hypothetical protein